MPHNSAYLPPPFKPPATAQDHGGGGLGLLSFDVQQHKGLLEKKTSHYLQIT